MKKKRGFAYGFMVLIGVLILFYPYISNAWNRHRDQQLISDYRQTIDEKPKMEKEAMWEAAVAYNDALGIQPVPDAFSLREGTSDPTYESLLNIQADGMMGFVDIPKIDIEIPVYHYTKNSVLEKGAGHLFGSALPVGGLGTHTVVSAHRGLPNAEMFTNLPQLEKGDYFYFHVLDNTLAYQVDQILTVNPDQVESLSGVEGKDYATLITCTPYGVNTQRLLVRGVRVPYDKETHKKVAKGPKKVDTVYLTIQIACALLGFALSFLIIFLLKKRDERRKKKA